MENKNRKKGFTLVAIILIMLILAMLGAVLASLQSVDFESSKQQLQSSRAFYLADAGVQHAFMLLENLTNGTYGPYYLGLGRYELVYSGNTTYATLTSHGYIPASGTPESRRSIEVSLDLTGGNLKWSFGGQNNLNWGSLLSGSEVNGDICIANQIAPNSNVPQCSGCNYLRMENVPDIQIPMIDKDCWKNFVLTNWPQNYLTTKKTFTTSPAANQVWYIKNDVDIEASSNDIIFDHVTIITEGGKVTVSGDYKVEMTAYVDPAHPEYTYPNIAVYASGKGNSDMIDLNAPSSGTNLQKRLKRVFDSLIYTSDGNVKIDYITGESAVGGHNLILSGLVQLDYKKKKLPCFTGGRGCGSGGGIAGGASILKWQEK